MKTYTAHCLVLMLIGALGAGCTSYREPDQPHSPLGAPVAIDRTSVGYDYVDEVETGMLLPNASGGTMMLQGDERKAPAVAPEEAFELKLKTRELAAQMLEIRDNQSLVGLVAMPASFVDLDDFTESTPLGRYLGEAMFYEFNQRSFPVREYRLSKAVALKDGVGELALSRSLPPVPAGQSWAALLVGTYQRDAAAVFVNARLVRASDGLVLRTAHIVLPLNNLVKRMTTKPPKPLFESGSLHVK